MPATFTDKTTLPNGAPAVVGYTYKKARPYKKRTVELSVGELGLELYANFIIFMAGVFSGFLIALLVKTVQQ